MPEDPCRLLFWQLYFVLIDQLCVTFGMNLCQLWDDSVARADRIWTELGLTLIQLWNYLNIKCQL